MEENYLTIGEINFFKQLQFEKKNLEDKVNYLESRLSSIEENHELTLSNLRQSQSSIKSLENKLSLVRHDLKEKESIIDTSEYYKEKVSETIHTLSTELKSLRKTLQQQNHTEEVELLKAKLCNLEKAFSQQAKEKSKLEHELVSMSEELLLHISNEGNLAQQIKKLENELENEKLDITDPDDKELTNGMLEDKRKTIDIYERFLTSTPNWESSMPDSNLFEKEFKAYNEVLSPFNKEHKNENLWKEMLQVEKACQKEILREEMQGKKEEKCASKKFGRATSDEFENSERNHQGLRRFALCFPDDLNISQDSLSSPESNSNQCNTLPEGEYASAECKDAVQVNQPESFRTVETVSTASQTEHPENASPVLLSRLAQKNEVAEDVPEDEVEYIFQKEEEDLKNKKNRQVFWNHKNCDLDMDIYRSCRKLSVLPEEETDDILTKKNPLENPCPFGQDRLKSKDFFLEDIKKAKCFKPYLNESPSSDTLIKPKLSQKVFPKSDNNPNASRRDETTLKVLNNELLLSVASPRDSYRQPRSFDSYFDPLSNKNSSLIRQISDPTQNPCAPCLTTGRRLTKDERSSLIKKPGSTCRPLRLPCDKDNEAEDGKLYKVRFNVPEQILSAEINFREMNFNPLATMKSNKNFRMISTFRIEIDDDINLNRFLEEAVVPDDDDDDDVNRNLICLEETKKGKKVLGGNSKGFCDAVEGLYTVKLDVGFSGRSDQANQFCQLKKRQKSDSSYFSGDDCRKKCRFLHNNRPPSLELGIPYIDPIIKNAFDASIDSRVDLPQDDLFILHSSIPGLNLSECLPACEKPFEIGSSNLSVSKPEALVKDVSGLELVNVSCTGSDLLDETDQVYGSNLENLQNEEEQCDLDKELDQDGDDDEDGDTLNRASSDISEGSESDTLTYKTVNTHLIPSSSDCDSDVYFTVRSDGSSFLERKSSDFSEDSTSPYTTPPDTSSAGFCTPPDHYSPILFRHYSN